MLVLSTDGVILVYRKTEQCDKFQLNKIAARWPAKAVAQFFVRPRACVQKTSFDIIKMVRQPFYYYKDRRKIIYGELKRDIANIFSALCKRKEVPIVEAEVCPDHIHMLVEIPPKMSVSEFVG